MHGKGSSGAAWFGGEEGVYASRYARVRRGALALRTCTALKWVFMGRACMVRSCREGRSAIITLLGPWLLSGWPLLRHFLGA